MTVNINAASISSARFVEQASNPATPSSGSVRLFVDNSTVYNNTLSSNTPLLKMIADDGTVTTFIGNVTASGVGITFPPQQVASSNANTLDDYEEGTWTPNLTRFTTGFTLTQTRSGRYIKIGSVVVLWGTINITAVSAQGSNFWALDGLPFALGTERGVVGSAGNLYSTTAITTSTVMMHIIAPTTSAVGNYFVFRNTTGAYINENAQAGTLAFSIIYDTTT